MRDEDRVLGVFLVVTLVLSALFTGVLIWATIMVVNWLVAK